MIYRKQVAIIGFLLVLFSVALTAQKRPYSQPQRLPQRRQNSSPIPRPVPSSRIRTLIQNRPNFINRNNRPGANRGSVSSRPPLKLEPSPKLVAQSSQRVKGKPLQSSFKSSSTIRRTNFVVPKLTSVQRTNMSTRLSGLRSRLVSNTSGLASNAGAGGIGGGGNSRPPTGGGGGGNRPPGGRGPNNISQKIANGHAFVEHRQELSSIGIHDQKAFEETVRTTMESASSGDVKTLARGRTAYWNDSKNLVIIHDPNHVDQGTAFVPKNGRKYFDELK